MNRTPFLARCTLLAPLLLVAALFDPVPGGAQYFYLDADGDGVHTDADVVSPSGTTHVDVWLDTEHDKNGSLQSCNSHSGASPGGVSEGPDMFSYDISLTAEDGEVSWGTYQDCVGFHVPPNEEFNTHTSTAIHITRYSDPGDEKPAGRYRLGSMTVTTTSGTPLIRFGLMHNGDYTCFGTDCPASEFPNSYVYGSDFYDADGLRYGGAVEHAPVFEAIAPVTVIQNHPVDVTLFASDEDLQALSFTKVVGPDFATVSARPLNGQASLHLAPGFGDLGNFIVQLRVSDGTQTADQFASVAVKKELTLYPVPDVTVQAGTTDYRPLYSDDPLGNDLTYSMTSGPSFVSIPSPFVPYPYGAAFVSFQPTLSDVGSYAVTIAVTNGNVTDQTTFHVNVTTTPVVPPDQVNRPPVAAILGAHDGVAGRAFHFDGSGSADPDGDLLALSWSFGDGSMAVSDVRPQHAYAAEGDYQVELTVHDKEFYRTATSTVHVSSTAAARGFVSQSDAASHDLEVRVQPIDDLFDALELLGRPASSFSLTNAAGDRIVAARLAGSIRDSDQDGIPDQGIVFAAADVARLTSRGVQHGVAAVTLRGTLAGGGQFVASLGLTPTRGRGPLYVDLSPNPLNPVGRLSFITSRSGPVDVRVYDIAGRLAHHPIDHDLLPAGEHEVLVGHGRAGDDLPSGIYFYRVETSEGVARGRFAIVR